MRATGHTPETSAVSGDAIATSAIEAWRRECGGRTPTRVDVLKAAHRKSTVLRLHGAGPDGGAVIAKRCPSELARIERTVYEDVLPCLPVASLELLGVVAGGDELAWLFLEDAGDVRWSPRLPEHRALATAWLAAVHLGATGLVETLALPARDADFHLLVSRTVREVLSAALENASLEEHGRELVRRVIADCVQLESRWAEAERLLQLVPRTLTLPGFGKKNVRVRDAGHGPILLPFDFESAAWGAPVCDLAQVDVDEYARLVGAAWNVDRDKLTDLATLGAALLSLKSIPGERRALSSEWPRRAVDKLHYYAGELATAIDLLGGESAARGIS